MKAVQKKILTGLRKIYPSSKVVVEEIELESGTYYGCLLIDGYSYAFHLNDQTLIIEGEYSVDVSISRHIPFEKEPDMSVDPMEEVVGKVEEFIPGSVHEYLSDLADEEMMSITIQL